MHCQFIGLPEQVLIRGKLEEYVALFEEIQCEWSAIAFVKSDVLKKSEYCNFQKRIDALEYSRFSSQVFLAMPYFDQGRTDRSFEQRERLREWLANASGINWSERMLGRKRSTSEICIVNQVSSYNPEN